ncbi:hypothetical protein AB0F96_39255 [Streptomyces sp. NPDC023998]|uniref:hypothetical protein n=1 Tax=Streptomyces sp. NPDC023998 TaxID=3154597 RepID=UPI00340C3810
MSSAPFDGGVIGAIGVRKSQAESPDGQRRRNAGAPTPAFLPRPPDARADRTCLDGERYQPFGNEATRAAADVRQRHPQLEVTTRHFAGQQPPAGLATAVGEQQGVRARGRPGDQ